MLDRVREACFSTLAPWFPGARVLDLFAGSGSLGLEALSRGAERVRLVERGREAVALLDQNIRELGLSGRVEVLRSDALSPASWGEPGVADGWDVVFLDPPYASTTAPKTRAELLSALRRLVASTLAPEGVLVLHVPRRSLASEDLAGLEAVERVYGTSSLWYVRPEAPDE